MKTFLKVCKSVRKMYPKIWAHHAKRDRAILVCYWLPGVQQRLFVRDVRSLMHTAYGVS